ncbi:MAG: NAD-dependent epimerase/dehydratase family protein [Spirosomataceae bacterium]
MKTILGTGQLGIAVMETLLKNNPNDQILLVNRKGKTELFLPGNVGIIAADVTDKTELETIARQSEVIFSCTDVPYQQWEDFYPKAASALAYALSKTNTRLVFADNLYSYGNVSGAVMQEEMPHQAKTKKGQIRAGVITVLLNSRKEFSHRVAIVKASDFIGPRIYKGIFGTDFLEKLFGHKSIQLFGKVKFPHTFTYIHDFAAAMVNVGSADDTFGQIWHVPNAPAMGLDKWVLLFEAETGLKAKVTVLPKGIVWMAGLFSSLIREFYELAYQYEYPYLVSHNKYVARFGNHSTDAQRIVKETIQWYQSLNK